MTIKELCEKHGLGQTALANRFGIPLRTVQNWHGGVRVPPDYLVRMMDELLTRDKEDNA
jgi:DNA-binding transcriptional regulator YiaG